MKDIYYIGCCRRPMPCKNFRHIEKQIAFLSKLQCSDELKLMDLEKPAYRSIDFSLRNTFFSNGDAEFLYQVIRFLKPFFQQ